MVWLPWILFSHILGISSSQLTFIFFRGVAQPPTRPYKYHISTKNYSRAVVINLDLFDTFLISTEHPPFGIDEDFVFILFGIFWVNLQQIAHFTAGICWNRIAVRDPDGIEPHRSRQVYPAVLVAFRWVINPLDSEVCKSTSRATHLL